MYEGQTQSVILSRMLNNAPDGLDKREGSVIYDASAPAAIEFMLVYAMADYFLKNTFGDTAEREWLIERAKERGLSPYPASYAVVKAAFTPATLEIPIGTRYSVDAVNYAVTSKTAAGEYLLTAETLGEAGNLISGTLVPIDYVAGLTSATITELSVPGDEEEETEHFRARYLASFDSQAYGGNIQDYLEKVNAIAGVGGVKVYPVWNGGGTVKLVIMTSENKVPSAELVDAVQTAIDPVTNQGEGVGIAPIGHHVTVIGVTNSEVAIGLHVTMATGYELDDYKSDMLTIIDEYFAELNETWPSTKKNTTSVSTNTGLVIRIAQIESRILEMDAVEDISHTTLNGEEDNLTLDVDALAVRGEITWA